MQAGDLIKVTKLGFVENPHHPHSVFGESLPFHVGGYMGNPVVGERFNAHYVKYRIAEGISTSPVTKIIDEHTFETMNSVYKWEKYEP